MLEQPENGGGTKDKKANSLFEVVVFIHHSAGVFLLNLHHLDLRHELDELGHLRLLLGQVFLLNLPILLLHLKQFVAHVSDDVVELNEHVALLRRAVAVQLVELRTNLILERVPQLVVLQLADLLPKLKFSDARLMLRTLRLELLQELLLVGSTHVT